MTEEIENKIDAANKIIDFNLNKIDVFRMVDNQLDKIDASMNGVKLNNYFNISKIEK